MKKKLPFIIEIFVGIIFICIGSFAITEEYYSTLFFAVGFGLAFASFIQLFKICYYEMPINKVKYENKKKEDYINSVDERKIFLRMKSTSMVFQLMTFVLLFLAFIFSFLRVDAWIIAVIFGLFLLQILLSVTIYKYLEKRM